MCEVLLLLVWCPNIWLLTSGVRWCEGGGVTDVAHIVLSFFVGVVVDAVVVVFWLESSNR